HELVRHLDAGLLDEPRRPGAGLDLVALEVRLVVEHTLVVLVGRRAEVLRLLQVVVTGGHEGIREQDVRDHREGREALHLVAEEVVGAAVGVRRRDAGAVLAVVARRAAVAVATGRAVGLVGVGGTRIRHAVAALGDVARAGRRAADRGALLIGRAVVADTVAALRHVARARRRAAHPRALRIRRAARAGARAALGRITRPGRRPAHGRCGLEAVRRARRARAVACLRIVAVIGRRAADEGPAGAGEAIRRTRCTAPRAVLGGIADTRRRPADRACRLEGVGRTGGRRAGAVLRDVTDARRRAANDCRRL